MRKLTLLVTLLFLVSSIIESSAQEAKDSSIYPEDESNNYLSGIQPSITLSSPNGGEIWKVGEAYMITWNSIGVNSVQISIKDPSISGSESTSYITENNIPIPAVWGRYDWAISHITQLPSGSGDNYKIIIYDANNEQIKDESDDFFSIIRPSIDLTFPNGGEVWTEGEIHRITWDSIGVDSVNIYIYVYDSNITEYNPNIPGSGSANYITKNGLSVPAAVGYYDWAIPPVSQLPGGGGTNYKIRIYDPNQASMECYSDDFFSIFPADLPSPGLTPDSPFYFLDVLGEKIGMFFTFGAEKKAEKALQYAEEKLAEVKVMVEKNKTEALEKIKQRYQEYLNLANPKVKETKEKIK